MTETLRVDGLTVEYPGRSAGVFHRAPAFRAVDGATFALERATTLALVGESGSGKTSIARAILGLAPVSAGQILLEGQDLVAGGPMGASARRRIQMVFQQPGGSLDPRSRIGDSVAEPLRHIGGMSGPALGRRVRELLELVGLHEGYANRYPRHLSGGQRQRVAVARAIGISPALVICDEPTSALDVSVQAQVLNLLVRLQAELGLAYLFITHDLAVVRQMADTVVVLHNGRVVETGTVDTVLGQPSDEYTRALLAAVPVLHAPAEPGHALPNDPALDETDGVAARRRAQ